MIDRRRFLLTSLAGAVAAPIAAGAQQVGKVPRIGVLGEKSPADPFLAAFRQGLRELGYTEGQNIVVEYRYANGTVDRFPELAAELIRLKVDVLVVGGAAAARAAKAKTKTVPIVFALPGDPVGSGLVASLNRPGGNATGTSTLLPELSRKQLELLKAAVPRVSRVTVLHNSAGRPVAGLALDATREAARALAVELQVLEVRAPNELVSAFAAARAQHADALLALSDPVLGNKLAQLAELAAKHRLPAIYVRREFAEAGGLLAYGPSFLDNYRRAATYVDKILKGAKPADLPVEQPTKVELVINLKTAKALGLTIPPSLLARADQVIE
jgi:putative tryptophan/tyrosine transport system substrate-binding protein